VVRVESVQEPNVLPRDAPNVGTSWREPRLIVTLGRQLLGALERVDRGNTARDVADPRCTPIETSVR
jgi:hypothetical protein